MKANELDPAVAKKLSVNEREVAVALADLAKKVENGGALPKIAIVMRDGRGAGRDIVATTDDDLEGFVAAIRKLTGPASVDAVLAAAPLTKPRDPETVEEARQESMGFILGIVDMARTFRPPAFTPPAKVLNTYADMIEQVAINQYGATDWAAFVDAARRFDFNSATKTN